jgi:hypothetical protein
MSAIVVKYMHMGIWYRVLFVVAEVVCAGGSRVYGGCNILTFPLLERTIFRFCIVESLCW